MNGELEVRGLDIYDDGQQLNVRMEIRNNSNRTVYAYRDVRGVRYDEASKTLRLLLTDRYVMEGPVRFIAAQPALIPIDPGESEKLSLRVARLLTQLGPQEGDRPGPTLREIPVYEAENVEVEISWSDTPFYREPGEKGGHAGQIRRWERGVLEARMERRGGPSTQQGPPLR
jgi:hypothetical protein